MNRLHIDNTVTIAITIMLIDIGCLEPTPTNTKLQSRSIAGFQCPPRLKAERTMWTSPERPQLPAPVSVKPGIFQEANPPFGGIYMCTWVCGKCMLEIYVHVYVIAQNWYVFGIRCICMYIHAFELRLRIAQCAETIAVTGLFNYSNVQCTCGNAAGCNVGA